MKNTEKSASKMYSRTEWNLDLLYTNATDPALERDVKSYEKACDAFEKKYKNSDEYLKIDTALASALSAYETLSGHIGGSKPIIYFYYRTALNALDQEADSQINQLSQRLTKAANKTLFFELSLSTLSKDQQKNFLKSALLEHFRYFLERVFDTAKYNLSEPEEKIMNLKSLPSHSMWIQGQEKLLNQQTVLYKGKQIPFPEAQNMFSQLPIKERHALADTMSMTLKKISHFAESELNAVITNKKINDELRGFKQPYSGTILGYQNDEKSILNLVSTVTKNFPISHRFYAVKAKMLKLKNFEYSDRAAKVGNVSIKPSFEESVEILRSAFSKANPEYKKILDSYLEKGQIDVYPKKGKRGGAFCSSNVDTPTYVFLNHVNSLDSLKTFAHEMGHAIHAEFSKTQTPLYQGHTISVAEVASTLFENFAFAEIFPRLSDKEKVIALHDRISDAISTIFRQIACFNFELELHQTVRAAGAISKEDIAKLHNKHMHAYLGPKFKMKEDDGYFFVQWPHIRSFFYVYSYAYGELISTALYKKYKEEPGYIQKIEEFLKAGGSMSPEDIFKSIGVDTSKPEFFEAGLKQIEEDIIKLEKLVSKM